MHFLGRLAHTWEILDNISINNMEEGFETSFAQIHGKQSQKKTATAEFLTGFCEIMGWMFGPSWDMGHGRNFLIF